MIDFISSLFIKWRHENNLIKYSARHRDGTPANCFARELDRRRGLADTPEGSGECQ